MGSGDGALEGVRREERLLLAVCTPVSPVDGIYSDDLLLGVCVQVAF